MCCAIWLASTSAIGYLWWQEDETQTMTTTRRVRKEVEMVETVHGHARWFSPKVEWIADEAGDYIEIDRGTSRGYVHVLDWDRYQRNYPEWAA